MKKNPDIIKIGTRASKLAMWQTEHVASLLNSGGLKTEIIPMETKGDKNLSQGFAEIGTKGIFTEELEQKLIHGEIDIAVHSAKDMQSVLPKGLEIIAFTEREISNDVVVSLDKNFSLKNDKESLLVGTSSTRRRAMLKHYYPHVNVTDARGNLQTRIRKMEEGQYQAMILAYAGVHRMNYDDLIVDKLTLEMCTPAVGQGSIAIEAAASLEDAKKILIKKLLNHAPTESCILAERGFLRKLEGGCSIPIFGLASIENENIVLTGGLYSLDGKTMIKEVIKGRVKEAEEIGEALAGLVSKKGGDKILEEILKNKK